MRSILLLLLVSFSIISCTSDLKDSAISVEEMDSSRMTKVFLYGLWSRDSADVLFNEGFYFNPDGSMQFIASDFTGEWKLTNNDTLEIHFHDYFDEKVIPYKIKRINESEMVLMTNGEEILYRKVPYGTNSQGNILFGQSSSLRFGEVKNVKVQLPSVKKISIQLKTIDGIKFKLFKGTEEVTSANLTAWNGILVQGGEYIVRIEYSGKGANEANYDLKVIAF